MLEWGPAAAPGTREGREGSQMGDEHLLPPTGKLQRKMGGSRPSRAALGGPRMPQLTRPPAARGA
jgi:hypothetical protein